MSDEIKTSSFAIVLTPEFDENGDWNSSVTAHMEEEVFDDLDTEELTRIRSVCGMVASTLTLMEQDEEFMEYVRDYFVENYSRMIEQFIEDDEQVPSFTRSEDGKVIQLNFNTKTHGSA
jgi:ABC-type transporter MlaC component